MKTFRMISGIVRHAVKNFLGEYDETRVLVKINTWDNHSRYCKEMYKEDEYNLTYLA